MRQLQRLDPLPAHVRMPSDIELARINIHGRGVCDVCRDTGTFQMWSGAPMTSEVVTYECSCVEQGILSRWLSVRGIPRFHQRLRWADVTAVPDETMRQVANVWNRLEGDIRHGLGVVFHGTSYTGKSMLAYLLARKLMHTGQFGVLGITAMDINGLDWRSNDSMQWWYHKVLPAEVLVYDRLGAEKASYGLSKVEELFGYRNDNMLATIVTTTFSPEDLRRRHGSNSAVEERADGPVYAPQAADLIDTRCHRITIPPGTVSSVTGNFERFKQESELNISRPYTFG